MIFHLCRKSRASRKKEIHIKYLGVSVAMDGKGLSYELCQSITGPICKRGDLTENIDLIPIQIKEKFGILSYYYSFKDMPLRSLSMIPKMKLRFDTACIVHNYQEKSMSICENCGKSGKLRSDLSLGNKLCAI